MSHLSTADGKKEYWDSFLLSYFALIQQGTSIIIISICASIFFLSGNY